MLLLCGGLTAGAGMLQERRRSQDRCYSKTRQPGGGARDFILSSFSRLAPIFQLTIIVPVALRRPLSICHLLYQVTFSAC